MSEHVWGENHDQPKDDVDNGNAGEESRNPTLHVMKDGQELEVFVVQNLLLAWRRVVHEREIIRAGGGQQP